MKTMRGAIFAIAVALGACGDDGSGSADAGDAGPIDSLAGSGGVGMAGISGGTGNAGASGAGGAGTSGVGGAGTSGAGGSAGAGNMPGAIGDCGGGGDVMTNPNGVMTSYPNISVSVFPSTFTMLNMHFVVLEDGDSRGPLLQFFAEIRNDRATIACRLLPEVRLDGSEIVTLAATAPYLERNTFLGSDGSTVFDCIEPGDTGVLSGLARGISEADLQTAALLSVDVMPRGDDVMDTYEYLPRQEPTLDAMPTETAAGWTLAGTMTPHAGIFNYSMSVFPRDGRGLIFAELMAYPGELEPLSSGVPTSFETEPAACAFEEYVVSQGWIDQ